MSPSSSSTPLSETDPTAALRPEAIAARALQAQGGERRRHRSRSSQSAEADAAAGAGIWQGVAFFLIAVLVLLPMPFGGWSLWASSLLSIAVGAALAVLGVILALGRATLRVPLRLYAVPLAMFAAVLLWALLQAVSWTPAALHHPLWTAAALALSLSKGALGTPLAGAISLDPAATGRIALELATYGAVFFLALQTAASATRAQLLLRAAVLAGTAYAVYGLFLYFTHSDAILWFQKQVYLNNVTATFENRNNFATFAGMSTIAALGLFLNELGKLAGADEFASRSWLIKTEYLWKKAWPYLVALGLLATALLLSQSRAGMVTTLIGIAVLLVALKPAKELRHVKFAWLFAAVAAALLVVILFSGQNTLARFDVRIIGEEARFPAWLAALDTLRAHPFIGQGLGAFEPAFRVFRSFAVDGRFMEAHSDVLENMVELGIPAAVLLDAVLVLLFSACFLGARARRRNAYLPAIGAAVTAQVGLHAFVDFSTQVPAVVVCFAVMLAVGFAQSFRERELEWGHPT